MSLNKNEREKEDLMVMNLAKAKRWRRCSKCRIYVEKNEGFHTFLAGLMEQSQNDQQQQHNTGQESQTASSRGKYDPAWEYFTVKYDKNHKAQYTGIYRMKYHLAKISGQIKVCSKVTEEVELQFKRILMGKK
ncbi:hypothetical protein Ahy_B02g057852 isoform B [Arachis hypogaea]|uniref:BED-type domain-containing protein n=1 Tax=Arachis hypogaea TaxID=3818 RepID=A0A445ACW9_ARAHY|nr:hypothetical protein Ahy_B02g057852 isoform B [Arachis hypogaea]